MNPNWMNETGTPKPRYPDDKKPSTGRPPGNPAFQDSELMHDRDRNPGLKNGGGFQPGDDPKRSPGHKVKPENRSIRRALVKLMNEPVNKQAKPITKADFVAHRLYELCQSNDPRSAIAALRECIDRIDGRTPISVKELATIKEKTASVVMIDLRLRPDSPSKPYVEMTPQLQQHVSVQLLEANEKGDDNN